MFLKKIILSLSPIIVIEFIESVTLMNCVYEEKAEFFNQLNEDFKTKIILIQIHYHCKTEYILLLFLLHPNINFQNPLLKILILAKSFSQGYPGLIQFNFLVLLIVEYCLSGNIYNSNYRRINVQRSSIVKTV